MRKIYLGILFLFAQNVWAENVMTGELENPGYDPLFWLKSSAECPVIDSGVLKRYDNFKHLDSSLLIIESSYIKKEFCQESFRCKFKWCVSSHNKAEHEEVAAVEETLSIDIRAKAFLGKMIRERRDAQRIAIDEAEKNEKSLKLGWERVEMPFDSDNNQDFIQQETPTTLSHDQQNNLPPVTPPANNQLPIIKKDKYFNILKKN